MSTITDVRTPDLVTQTDIGEAITVRLVGSAETDAKTELEGFLRRLHEATLASTKREVVIDFRSLEFMTSSCLNAFVGWIGKIKDAPPDHQYKLRFLSDPKKQWQSRSLFALACFGVDIVKVETP